MSERVFLVSRGRLDGAKRGGRGDPRPQRRPPYSLVANVASRRRRFPCLLFSPPHWSILFLPFIRNSTRPTLPLLDLARSSLLSRASSSLGQLTQTDPPLPNRSSLAWAYWIRLLIVGSTSELPSLVSPTVRTSCLVETRRTHRRSPSCSRSKISRNLHRKGRSTRYFMYRGTVKVSLTFHLQGGTRFDSTRREADFRFLLTFVSGWHNVAESHYGTEVCSLVVPAYYLVLTSSSQAWDALYSKLYVRLCTSSSSLLSLVPRFKNLTVCTCSPHQTDGNMTWGPDPSLTPLGISQALEVNRVWKEELSLEMKEEARARLPDVVWTSPLRRAAE